MKEVRYEKVVEADIEKILCSIIFFAAFLAMGGLVIATPTEDNLLIIGGLLGTLFGIGFTLLIMYIQTRKVYWRQIE
jgi:uncharacterized membrane protein